jgi:hypothetical protein
MNLTTAQVEERNSRIAWRGLPLSVPRRALSGHRFT